MELRNILLIIYSIVFLCGSYTETSAQNFVWAKQIDGYDNSIEALKIDIQGNIYIAGNFKGNTDFKPGVGTFTMAANDPSVFICKFNSAGTFIWAKKIAGCNGCSDPSGKSIGIDKYGNIYTGGSIMSQAFVCKHDSSGNQLWVKKLFNNSQGVSMALDTSGNAYITGWVAGSIFISKINTIGSLVWTNAFGSGSNFDVGNSIAVDSSGNVYTAGKFEQTIDFDAGSGTYTLTATGTYDGFILKSDSSGNFIWVKQLVSSVYGDYESIILDGERNIYTTGNFGGKADFDPAISTYTMISASWDIFVSKMDSSGNLIWAKKMGGSGNDGGYSITTDRLKNIYTTGFFSSTADFDPGANAFNLTAGSEDIFISKLDSNGNFIWAVQMGSSNDERATSIILDSYGYVYTGGYFQSGTVDFNPGTGVYNMSCSYKNGFISKLTSSLLTPISQENSLSKHPFIFPNPATTSVAIRLPYIIKDTRVRLYTLMGQTIQDKRYNDTSKIQIDLNDIAFGVYFIQIVYDGSTFTQKLIVDGY